LDLARKSKLQAKVFAAAAKRAAGTREPLVPVHNDMGFEPDSDDEDLIVAEPPVDAGPPEIPEISKDVFLVQSVDMYKRYKTACKQLPWATLFPEPEFCVGVAGIFWQELLYDCKLTAVWKTLDKLNFDQQFGFFPIMARHSKASVYKLQASSFCERVNSAGKIVFNHTNLNLSTVKVEQRTMLRMNRKWLVHMRKHYPDCTADLMVLLRNSHDALNPNLPNDDSDDD
jgi:hypothetical protein